MAQWLLLLLLCVCRGGEDGRHALSGVGREGGGQRPRIGCVTTAVPSTISQGTLPRGELPKHVPRRHRACTRYGGVVLGIDMGTGDQGSEVGRLDKPSLV
jgi:hypothetical protein